MTAQAISRDEARARLADVIDQQVAKHALYETGLRAAARRDSDWRRIDFTQGVWADEATVTVSERCSALQVIRGEESKLRVTYHVDVSWSSTHRSVAMAGVALANYAAALDVATRLQAWAEAQPEVVYEVPGVEVAHG